MPLRLLRAATFATPARTTRNPTNLVLSRDAWSIKTRHGATAHVPFCCRAAFHATAQRWLAMESRNHYERLNVPPEASPRDIKKSFYALSKTHHPDANPSSPDAAQSFSLISESYSVLSDPRRRAAYDRDVLRLHERSSSPGAAPRGSYHSTNNPAGGRSPSGLSRRRGTFRGPPPSFYRSGGWGTQGEKRRKAHEESTGTGTGPGAGAADAGADAGGAYGQHRGGMGPGSDPYGHHDDVWHFDKEGHTRTHQRQDRRRWQRERRAVGDDDVEFEPQMSLAGHFFVIAGILGATFLAPLVYLQFMRLGRRNKDER